MNDVAELVGETYTPNGRSKIDRDHQREAIHQWLIAKVAEVLGFDAAEIDVEEPLATYGMGSIPAVSLTGDLEDWLGLELPPTLVWEHPTISALTDHLDEELASQR